ncbi:MAG TPA: homoserine dehydrogenase [Spirochaetia bacterium]|nr:homoserine dehydrogenase [Spirochaetia bacterium]
MKYPRTKLKVAVIGCGTVGSEVASMLLERRGNTLSSRTDVEIELGCIVDVDFSVARKKGLDPKLFCSNLDSVLQDRTIQVVIELIGGNTIAKEVILKALDAGKHVVTANKALLAESGVQLLSKARTKGVTIEFEASCAGGIPIILALSNGLIANRCLALYGILNGTCNYILTEMTREGKSYSEALREAQQAGFAEADPYLDVSGHDTAHKLAILAALAFGGQIDLKTIPITGIDSLDKLDIAYGQELGYVIKLLAIAKYQDRPDKKGLSLCIRPAFISKEHPLAWVSGPFNAVSVYGHATGHTMYYGRGAGGSPTASAILSDLHAIAAGSAGAHFDHFLWPDRVEPAQQLPVEDMICRHYLRVMAEDRPGVLAQIASKLGSHDISIRSVLQKESPEGSDPSQGVPVVITTYESREGSMQNALEEINDLDVVRGESICIEIVDEHPEHL